MITKAQPTPARAKLRKGQRVRIYGATPTKGQPVSARLMGEINKRGAKVVHIRRDTLPGGRCEDKVRLQCGEMQVDVDSALVFPA